MSDLISRQTAIGALCKRCDLVSDDEPCTEECNDIKILRLLPSAQPDLDEWCKDCKEYDPEKHCCPRFNRVIRNALKDAQPEIIRCGKCKHRDKTDLCDVWDEYITNDEFYCGCAERGEE